jgi:glycosyltransferase involved in cell wall biosynthesis
MNINILMATYNGEKYLAEQLESLQAQTYQDWTLYVRDDGSQDNTLDILRRYALQDSRISILDNNGERLGACGNFSFLMEQSLDAEYVMFCDQDDVWMPDKIQLTLEAMLDLEAKYGNMPLMIYTDLQVVDDRLNTIANSFLAYQSIDPKRNNLHDILVTNPVAGCTALLNRVLVKLAAPIPTDALGHDCWCSLVASAFGKLEHLSKPLIYYRQHGRNDVGAYSFNFRYIAKRTLSIIDLSSNKLRATMIRSIIQAKSFLSRYSGKLDVDSLHIIQMYTALLEDTFWERRIKIIKYKFFRHGLVRNLGLMLRV